MYVFQSVDTCIKIFLIFLKKVVDIGGRVAYNPLQSRKRQFIQARLEWL